MKALSVLIALLLLLPILLFALSAATAPEMLAVVPSSLLTEVSLNTLILMLKVMIISGTTGVFFAWHVKLYKFPGARLISFLLIAPLAIPPYIGAFVFLGLWDYAGSVQELLRVLTGWQGGVDIRSGSWGIALAMSTIFTPYVYLLTCSSLQRQSASVFQAALLYGSERRLHTTVLLLKLIRPGIVAGIALVMMEVLADFGMVSMFNFNTFTLAIYSAWEDYRDLNLAIVMSLNLLIIAFALVWIEETSRGRRRFDNRSQSPSARVPPSRRRAYVFYTLASLWFAISTVLPLTQLLVWSLGVSHVMADPRHFDWLINSLMLTFFGIAPILACALLFAWLRRNGGRLRIIAQLFSAGYALPGTILALIMLILTEYLEVLAGFTLVLIVWAYILRFLPLGIKPINASWASIPPSMEIAAFLYSQNRFFALRRFYLPLLRSGVLFAVMLLFLDLIKELPITLILHPLGWESLSVRIYNLTSEGLYEEAAPTALLLTLITALIFAAFRWTHDRLPEI